MIRNMATSALAAGCAAWLLAVTLHFAFVQKYILLGELYETGAAEHFAGVTAATVDHASGAAHDHGATDDGAKDHGADTPSSTEAEGHDHGKADASSGLSRNLWTGVFFGLVYVAYALILCAGFGLVQAYGRMVTARDGLLWGMAGFAAFQLAPAMGLAPELPGTLAAELAARQLWWWGTVAVTAAALGLIGYGRTLASAALAVLLLALPHVIGAPEVEGFSGVAPPEVAAAFSARVLGTGLAVWAAMGWVAGAVWERTAGKAG